MRVSRVLDSSATLLPSYTAAVEPWDANPKLNDHVQLSTLVDRTRFNQTRQVCQTCEVQLL